MGYASFVPPAPIRGLRDLTRYGELLVQEHTHASWLQKALEDRGGSVPPAPQGAIPASGRAGHDPAARPELCVRSGRGGVGLWHPHSASQRPGPAIGTRVCFRAGCSSSGSLLLSGTGPSTPHSSQQICKGAIPQNRVELAPVTGHETHAVHGDVIHGPPPPVAP